MSYLSGSVSSVATVSHFFGSSGSRPGFSGGPIFSEYTKHLIGFVVSGGLVAKTCEDTIAKSEWARYLLGSLAFHSKPQYWTHGTHCYRRTPDTSDDTKGNDDKKVLLYSTSS